MDPLLIEARVCETFGVTHEHLTLGRRCAANARAVCCWLLYETGQTHTVAGKRTGVGPHAAMKAYEKVNRWIAIDGYVWAKRKKRRVREVLLEIRGRAKWETGANRECLRR